MVDLWALQGGLTLFEIAGKTRCSLIAPCFYGGPYIFV